MRTSPFKMKSVTRKSKRATVRHGVGTSSEVVTVAEPVIPRGPWVLGLPLYLAGLFLRRVWLPETREQLVFSAVFLVAGVAVGAFSWFYAKARTRFQQWHATVTPVAFVVILVVPLNLGWGRYSSLCVLTYWISLSAGWVARVARSVWGDGVDMHHHDGPGRLAESLGLTGVTVAQVTHHGTPGKKASRITSRWTMPAPFGHTEILKARDAIINTARAAHVTIRRVHTDPRSADMTVVFRDQLREARTYPGPSLAPGASIQSPLTIGTRQDGAPEQVVLVTEQGTVRCLVVGCAGSGKSRLLWVILAETAGCTDVVWWIADVAKAGQTVNPARDMFDWIAPDLDQAGAMLDAVAQVAKARSTALGDDQSWHPGCGFPLLVVWVEEAAGVSSESGLAKRITRLAEQVRSTGIVLVLSMQRPSGKNMPTDARAQFTSAFCFGTDDPYTPKMALNPGTLEAGATPDLIADTVPGLHWHEGPGVPRTDWAEPCRTYRIEAADLRQIVARTAGHRTHLDAMSTRAAGGAYAHRHDTPRTSTEDTTQDQMPAPIQLMSLEDHARAILAELGPGQHRTKDLVALWEARTGRDRRSMYRTMDGLDTVINNGDGTWVVRPGA